MSGVSLKGQIRIGRGKEAAKKLREKRLIPGVVYGGTAGPVHVTIDPLELAKALGTHAGENALITLSVAGDGERTTTVILKELQRDPVRGEPLHVDFLEISMKRKIKIQVPLRFVGEPIGVRDKGGFLEQHLREVTVECLPGAIPDQIQLEVGSLDVGDSIHVRDLRPPEGVKIVEDAERPVVSVLAVAVVVEEAPPAEAKPAEPEVVGRKEAKPVEPEVVGRKEAKPVEPEVVGKKEAKEAREGKKEARKAEG
jgi:large subunit ribosomal protein L25